MDGEDSELEELLVTKPVSAAPGPAPAWRWLYEEAGIGLFGRGRVKKARHPRRRRTGPQLQDCRDRIGIVGLPRSAAFCRVLPPP